MMSKRYTLCLMGVLLTLALAACNSSNSPTEPEVTVDPNQIMISAKDHGETIELEVGQVLAVVLASNPTTGYSWQVAEIDPTILAVQAEIEFEQDADQEGLVGSGGREILRFDALKAGQTELTLFYQRPWEQDVEPDEIFSVAVIVR
jgi:inhibitor of cysteine peptidase